MLTPIINNLNSYKINLCVKLKDQRDDKIILTLKYNIKFKINVLFNYFSPPLLERNSLTSQFFTISSTSAVIHIFPTGIIFLEPPLALFLYAFFIKKKESKVNLLDAITLMKVP